MLSKTELRDVVFDHLNAAMANEGGIREATFLLAIDIIKACDLSESVGDVACVIKKWETDHFAMEEA
jgi:hypothetical protein